MDSGRIVTPRTRREIERLAMQARHDLELSPNSRVAMLPILEQVLYEVLTDKDYKYDFRVREDREMGKCDGLTDDQKPIIYLKDSVYRSLERGEGRARFTAAHEFGHLYMHCGLPTFRAFTEEYDPLTDPERQANLFAAAFLMPEEAFRRCKTVREAMKAFGVSQDAALCRSRRLQHPLEMPRPILTIAEKNRGRNMRSAP